MTIEIRQLVIRAVVQPTGSPVAQATATGPTWSAAEAAEPSPPDLQPIVDAAVREVLRRLERARRR